MAWAIARHKTFAPISSLTPADMNAIQDQYVRATGITHDDLDAASVAVPLGLTQTAAATGGAAVRRGKSIIATEETIVAPAAVYTLATTPDRVSGIVLPTNGFITVGFQITVKSTVASAGAIAVFLGAVQTQIAAIGTTAPEPSEALMGANSTLWQSAASGTGGPCVTNHVADYTGDLTTGMVLGAMHHSQSRGFGLLTLFAAAGSYDVSLKYKAPGGGDVLVKNRKLWVWTMGPGA